MRTVENFRMVQSLLQSHRNRCYAIANLYGRYKEIVAIVFPSVLRAVRSQKRERIVAVTWLYPQVIVTTVVTLPYTLSLPSKVLPLTRKTSSHIDLLWLTLFFFGAHLDTRPYSQLTESDK